MRLSVNAATSRAVGRIWQSMKANVGDWEAEEESGGEGDMCLEK